MNNNLARYLWAAGMATALMTPGLQSSAQTNFSNGRVSFDVPEHWHTETSEREPQSVRLKADSSAATFLIIFDTGLPMDLNALGGLTEKRAFSEVEKLFPPATGLKVEQGCPSVEVTEFSGHKATKCTTLLKDAQDFHAFMTYFGVPLGDTTCLIVAFSSNYKGDVETLQAAFEVLGKTLNFASTSDGTWRSYTSADFSFQYPGSWEIHTVPARNEAFATDNAGHGVGVRFVAGARNRADIFNQCASEDELLNQIYKTDYEIHSDTGHYPSTEVTHDNYMPGFLGGKETWVSIVYQEAYKKPVAQVTWLNVVPRATGIYVVTYWHKSEPMEVSEPLRKAFAKSIAFTSGALDKNAYCNYLGK